MAFVDLENAFPSVDRATLWVKLHEWGVRGPLMDWLRMLYFRLRYVVRCGGRISTAFQSFIGILIGDPASPHLWNLFMADFALKDDPDDITLNGRRISHMEHIWKMARCHVALHSSGRRDSAEGSLPFM